MNKTQALRAAVELLGASAYIERYPAKKTKAFGVTRVAVAQFVVGKNLGAPGVRDRRGVGLSWEEALENAKQRQANR